MFNSNHVEVIAMGCITAYYYYEQLCRATKAKILNPLHMVAAHLRENFPFAGRVGVLATTGTLRSGLFHKALADGGVEIVTLDRDDQETWFMRSVYMKNGYKSARISDDARALMDRCVEWMEEKRVDVIIGGCTEVSIAIDPAAMALPYIDMLDLMARKAVDYCYDLNHILNTELNG
jgi:aspartate racemase